MKERSPGQFFEGDVSNGEKELHVGRTSLLKVGLRLGSFGLR